MMHLMYAFDLRVLDFLYSIRTVPMTLLMIDVTQLGRWQILLGLSLALSLVLALYRRWSDIAGLFVSVLGSGAAILALKVLVQRPRPELWYQAYTEGSDYSFPSGHAGLSMAFYAFIAYLLLQSAPSAIRRSVIACMPVIIVLVSFSRLYLGVHYLSDVIAGLVLGALFVGLGIATRLRNL